jgi:RNA polymerase sigma-70 factor (ECF subfamily)
MTEGQNIIMNNSFANDDLFAVVTKAISGDDAAFEELLRRKMATISYHIRMILASDSDVEDVIQEVALTMYRNIRKLKDVRAINVWLQRIITSRTMDHIKVNKRHEGAENIEDYDNVLVEENKEFLPADLLEHDGAKTLVKEILKTLPPQRRRALTLYYFEDMSYKDIAASMNLAVSSVATSILRGKETIKERLVASDVFEGISPLLAAASIPVTLHSAGDSTVLHTIFAEAVNNSVTPSQIDVLTNASMKFINAKIVAFSPKAGISIAKGITWTIAATASAVLIVLGTTGHLTDTDDLIDIPILPPTESMDIGPTETTDPADPITPGIIAFSDGKCPCGHLNPQNASIAEMDLSGGNITWIITAEVTQKTIKSGDGAVATDLTVGQDGTLADGNYNIHYTYRDNDGQSAYLDRIFTIDFSGANIDYR